MFCTIVNIVQLDAICLHAYRKAAAAMSKNLIIPNLYLPPAMLAGCYSLKQTSFAC